MNVFLYATTVFFWGLSWYGVQLQLGVVAPEVSVAYRFLLAAGIMIPFCILTARSLRYSVADHLRIAAQGFLLFGTNFYLIYEGSAGLASGFVSILFATILIMNTVGGWVFMKAPVEIKAIVGAALGLGGITLIFWPEVRSFDWAGARSQDIMLVMAGTLSASLGMLLSALNQRRGLPVTETNAIGMTYGALFFVIYSLVRGAEFHVEWTLDYVGSLVFLSIGSSVIAFWTFLTLVGRIGPGKASYAMVMMPVVALVVSSLFEDFEWTLTIIIGVGLVLLGNMFILGKSRVKPQTKSSPVLSR